MSNRLRKKTLMLPKRRNRERELGGEALAVLARELDTNTRELDAGELRAWRRRIAAKVQR